MLKRSECALHKKISLLGFLENHRSAIFLFPAFLEQLKFSAIETLCFTWMKGSIHVWFLSVTVIQDS